MEPTKLELAFRRALERRNGRGGRPGNTAWGVLADPAFRGRPPESGGEADQSVTGTGMSF